MLRAINSRRIFTIGESVLDILFKKDIAVHSVTGGSMLNCAVSLARLQCPTYLISELSNDLSGNIILKFLKENNIHTDYLSVTDDGKTAISIASFDKNNDAQYDFYRELPSKRLDISLPNFTENDIVAFGSFFAISKEVRKPLMSILSAAKKSGALIFYDPNIRNNHCPLNKEDLEIIEENISLADVIRGSNEDFFNIYGISNMENIFERVILSGCENIFITCGKDGSWFKSIHSQVFIPSKSITPISTIGAGDTFNAGILSGLIEYNITKTNLLENLPKYALEIGKNAVEMASKVCMSLENYIEKN